MRRAYRLLIGSVGDDSHSVGIWLLTLAFREDGFFVKNIGILNDLDDIFRRAGDFDAVLVSCINGHADLYFEEFPRKLSHFNLTNGTPRVWYLGGNLSVRDKSEDVIKKYRNMGFDFVSSKPIPWERIRNNLIADFHRKGIRKKDVSDYPVDDYPSVGPLEDVNDEVMSDEEFSVLRDEVLASWPTGGQVGTADIRRNHSDPQKNINRLIVRRQSAEYKPLLQPRTGVAHVEDEIALLKYLRENGLDISSIQLDAACRKNMYHKAREGVVRSEKGKTSLLNGYPVPIHGVEGMERIIEAIDTPFQIRAGSPDHRLTYEIGLAGGASSVEGGFICYLIPYDKHTSPVANLRNWKYVDKLAGLYYRNYGVVVNREYFGALTTSLIEPTIPIVINIVQAVLSAKSGVRCISVGLAEQGNRSQDIAAIRVIDSATRRYLSKYGFDKCTVSTVYHQYMAAFPSELRRAEEMIINSSVTGTLAGATKFMTKTPVESIHIPFKEDNARGLDLTQLGVAKVAEVRPETGKVQDEMAMLERQVTSIMNVIEVLGQGSLARGIIKAFEEGILDIPFSPSVYNRNELITARDVGGAIRYVNPETLPFDEDIVEFHKEKIDWRMTEERLSRTSQVIEKDLTRIWKNDCKGWPLDGHYVS
jgi:methylaspartate mutase epsilon subunit